MEENIKNLLLDEEEILWQGKPNKKLFTSADWYMIPSTMFGFAIMVLIRVYFIPIYIGMEVPFPFDIMYAIVFFSLLYQMVLRFFIKAYVMKRTEYYVTNQRVLEIRNLNTAKVEKIKINKISNINSKIVYNGRSKIVFGDLPPFYSLIENTYAYPRFTYSSYNKPPIGFYDLDAEDAEEICSIVSKIKSSL